MISYLSVLMLQLMIYRIFQWSIRSYMALSVRDYLFGYRRQMKNMEKVELCP